MGAALSRGGHPGQADQNHTPIKLSAGMPSFFGYMAWSFGILVPLFVILTFLFFR